MSRRILVAMAMLLVAIVWYSATTRDDPASVVLNKIGRLMEAETVDYAVATQFLGTPLDASKLELIVSGNAIQSRAAEYFISRHRGNPPGFDRIGFDMVWQAEHFQSALRAGHAEKGLRSHLSVSFDPGLICITKWMLWIKFGWTMPGGFSHGDSVSMAYGDKDRRRVSFTFHESDCAADLSVVSKNPAANWVVPADASASEAEFITRFLPIDKSGGPLEALGFRCGPSNSTSSKPEDTGCVCEWDRQTPAGPCHYSVNFSTLKEDSLQIRVWALPDREAN